MSNKISIILYNNSSVFIKIEKYFQNKDQTAASLIQELTEQLAKVSFVSLSIAFWSLSDIWEGQEFGQRELKYLPADRAFNDLIYPMHTAYSLYRDYVNRYKQAQLGSWPRVSSRYKCATLEKQAESERMNVRIYESTLDNYFRDMRILVGILNLGSIEKYFEWMSKEDFDKFMNVPDLEQESNVADT